MLLWKCLNTIIIDYKIRLKFLNIKIIKLYCQIKISLHECYCIATKENCYYINLNGLSILSGQNDFTITVSIHRWSFTLKTWFNSLVAWYCFVLIPGYMSNYIKSSWHNFFQLGVKYPCQKLCLSLRQKYPRVKYLNKVSHSWNVPLLTSLTLIQFEPTVWPMFLLSNNQMSETSYFQYKQIGKTYLKCIICQTLQFRFEQELNLAYWGVWNELSLYIRPWKYPSITLHDFAGKHYTV